MKQGKVQWLVLHMMNQITYGIRVDSFVSSVSSVPKCARLIWPRSDIQLLTKKVRLRSDFCQKGQIFIEFASRPLRWKSNKGLTKVDFAMAR